MDGPAWWASLLSTAGIRLNTAYLHTTRVEFIQSAGKSLFLAYSGRIMSQWFFFFPPCLTVWLPTNSENFPAAEIHLQNSLMIGILRHDTGKWASIVPPCKIGPRSSSRFLWEEWKSPQSLQGCWPLESDANFLLEGWGESEWMEKRMHRFRVLLWFCAKSIFRPVRQARVSPICFLVEFLRWLYSTAISRLF